MLKQRPSALIIVAIVVISAIAAVFGTPRIMWWYHTNQAGLLLKTGLAWGDNRTPDSLPTLKNEQQVQAAIAHLMEATRWRPDHLFAYTQLGWGYAALGDNHKALSSLNQAQLISPRNPLPALASLPLIEQSLAKQATDPALLQQYQQSLRNVGLPSWQYIERGDNALAKGNLVEAQTQFERAMFIESFSAKPANALQWRYALASFATRQKQRIATPDLAEWIQTANGSTILSGKSFRLLDTKPIEYVKDPNIGTLFLNEAAYKIVNFTQSGKYRIVLRAENSPPPPIKAQVEIDFKPIAQFDFELGDGTKREKGLVLDLSAGTHVIAVRFLNDNSDNLLPGQKDRDLSFDGLVFDWIDKQAMTIYPVTDKVHIEGEELQTWERKPLKVSNDPTIGAIFVSGTAAIGLETQKEGTYVFRVRVLNPGAVQNRFLLEADQTIVAQYDLPNSGKWETFEIPIKLSAGKHVLGVHLWNNFTSQLTVNYVLALDWVEVEWKR
jgi:hypothetical protein